MAAISEKVEILIKELRAKGISVKYDKRDTHKPGWKFAEYELKGVPVRIAMGPRDLENGTMEIARRDTKEKQTVSSDQAVDHISGLLEEMQKNIFKKAEIFRDENTHSADSIEEFKELIESGAFVHAHWDGTAETEERIKDETKATIRCIPLDSKLEEGKCIFTGKPSKQRVLFAKAY